MRGPEILAPAGGWDALVAAVRCGADAVYLGGPQLNARRSAHNFDRETLVRAAAFCHARGVKVYLTLNTVIYDEERHTLRDAVREACEAGVDALIVQDLAVAALARACAPDMPLHASTQMSVHSLDGARMLASLGFSRVVLARELSGEEMGRIAAASPIKTECFVHGALCSSISGQCYLSAAIGGRSGNRGMCAQPCRLPFQVEEGANSHALSLRDLSLVEQIPLMAEMGVASLKIEGRMKRPEYVAAATRACRDILDGRVPDLQGLEAVFSRSGFTDGYFAGKRGRNLYGTREKENVVAAQPVLKELEALYRDEVPKVPVSMQLRLAQEVPATLTAADRDGNRVTMEGDVPQEARTAPTTPERAQASLGKMGGTPYFLERLEADIGDGLMLPASSLNALRRQALEALDAARSAPPKREFQLRKELFHIDKYAGAEKPATRVRLHKARQLTEAVMDMADEIALPLGEVEKLPAELLERVKGRLLVELPPFLFDDLDITDKKIQIVLSLGLKKALCGTLDAVGLAKRHGMAVSGDFGLNITNSLALEEWDRMGADDATLSFELDMGRISRLGGSLRRGILAYGYLPLMRLRHCPNRAAQRCGDCGGFPTITDRKGNHFLLDCLDGITTLYNCVPLYLADRLAELKGVDFITLYFTAEEPWECDEILQLYRQGKGITGRMTRGLYYRKVQ